MELISSPRSLLPHAQLVLQRQPGPGFRRVSLQKITEFLLFLTETATAVAWVPGPPGRRRKGSGKKALNPHFLPPSLSLFFFFRRRRVGVKMGRNGEPGRERRSRVLGVGASGGSPGAAPGGGEEPVPRASGRCPTAGEAEKPLSFFFPSPKPVIISLRFRRLAGC